MPRWWEQLELDFGSVSDPYDDEELICDCDECLDCE